jgi:nicotinate-nucleotide pyrophosphorylase (carboxylating)
MLELGMQEVIAKALQEDAPMGDVTSLNLIPEEAHAVAQLHAREAGVMSGSDVIAEVFRQINPSIVVESFVADGETFNAHQLLVQISGDAQAVLRGERIALNFSQRMCGIATLTAQYVAAVAGTKAKILDTRKTTPNLRLFERAAVRAGGGQNHRFSLSDAVLIKDNHLSVLAQEKKDITAELLQLRKKVGQEIAIEVEVDRLDQIPAVIAGNVDIIMLDNFSLDDLRSGISVVDGKALVEASGGVTLATVADIAQTGVDYISVGALTHSVRALDLGLDIELKASN